MGACNGAGLASKDQSEQDNHPDIKSDLAASGWSRASRVKGSLAGRSTGSAVANTKPRPASASGGAQDVKYPAPVLASSAVHRSEL